MKSFSVRIAVLQTNRYTDWQTVRHNEGKFAFRSFKT